MAHDGEKDHVARRSPLSLATYAFSRLSRYRRGGITAITGNSTQPHLHIQVTDSPDWGNCRGLPMTFRFADGSVGMPGEGEIVTGP